MRRNLENSEVGRWVRNTFPAHHTLSKHFTNISPPRKDFSTHTFHPSVKSVWLPLLPAFPRVSEVKFAQPCLTLCDPMDYIVHGILQARILEWIAFLFSRGSSQPQDGTQVSRITGGFFTK